MSKDDNEGHGREYDVGYCKPPRHTQFLPGQSGFKGRKKKKTREAEAEMIARIRDQQVTVDGRTMSMLELAVHSTMNQTIKSGKPKDLKVLFELLEKHGAISQDDRYAQTKAGADETVRKIFERFDRQFDIDPADAEAIERAGAEEAQLIIMCPDCGPELRRRWAEPDYKAISGRCGRTGLHSFFEKATERNRQKKRGS